MSRALLVCLLLVAFSCLPALAQTAAGKPAACEPGVDDHDAVIAACARLIDSRKLRGDKLAAAYAVRADAWYWKKDFDKALADINAAITARPGKADDLANRGIYKHERGDYDGAIADYTAALHIEPAANTYANRGFSLLDKYDYAHALPDFNEAIDLSAGESAYYMGRGLAQRNLGKYRSAARDFESASTHTPADPTALCERGIAYFYDTQFSDAVRDFDQCPKNIGYGYAYTRLWRYLAQARGAGDGADIRMELDAKGLIGREWPGPVRAMLLGRMKPEALIAAAADPDAEKAKGRNCEARFYIGEYHLIRGEKAAAKQRFNEAKSACAAGFMEYQGAVAELQRLK